MACDEYLQLGWNKRKENVVLVSFWQTVYIGLILLSNPEVK